MELNELQEEFFEHDSEIETGARECLAMDFEFVARAYGYDADVEELIGTKRLVRSYLALTKPTNNRLLIDASHQS